MKTITVFTPTYNRAYILERAYISLKHQSCKDFIWLIIDDGSTDETETLVKKWIKEKEIEIDYLYKINQGMHSVHNIAYEKIKTPLNVCLDSDDMLTDDAVEIILSKWDQIKDNDNIAGIIGLDITKNGKIIGTNLPNNIESASFFDIYYKHKTKGDKKLVYKTNITKLYKYPVYENEKYFGLSYIYNKIDCDGYKLLLVNKPLCIVDYQNDGSTNNKIKELVNNPKGFVKYRIENIKMYKNHRLYCLKENIHYVSSSLILKNKKIFRNSPTKITTIIAFPFGFLLFLYIKHNYNKKYKRDG